MENVLDLYRGDATKIDHFDIKKTFKFCLLGRGIYLTDSIEVAESYCDKDADSNKKSTVQLFHGLAKDRNDAFFKGFQAYCDHVENYDSKVDGSKMSVKQRFKLEEQLMGRYKLAREEGIVQINYTPNAYYATKAKDQKALEVIYHRREQFGHVSHFQVVKNIFDASVINVDEPVRDPEFWRLMYANRIKVGLEGYCESDYIASNINRLSLAPNEYRRPADTPKPDYFTMAKVLAPYGIIGLEYRGGTYIGGKGYHRAFCIWDEDFVNQSKVGMLR